MSWWGKLDDQKKAATALVFVGSAGLALGATFSSFATGIWNAPEDIAELRGSIDSLVERLAEIEQKEFVEFGDRVSFEHGNDLSYFMYTNAQPKTTFDMKTFDEKADANTKAHYTLIVTPGLDEK